MTIHRPRARVLLAVAAAVAVSLGLAADNVPVHRKSVEVYKSKSLMSGVAYTAKQGEVLQVTDRGADGWWTVAPATDATRTGYVRGVQLTDAKMVAAPSATPLSGGRDATASAAAKGIGADATKVAANKHYDIAPVNRMIDTRSAVTPNDVAQFRKDAGLR